MLGSTLRLLGGVLGSTLCLLGGMLRLLRLPGLPSRLELVLPLCLHPLQRIIDQLHGKKQCSHAQ